MSEERGVNGTYFFLSFFRKIALRIEPTYSGDHTFLVFNESEGHVDSRTFTVLSAADGEKKKKEILEKKEREKREQEERQRQFEEMLAKRQAEEAKRRETVRRLKEEREEELKAKRKKEVETGKAVAHDLRNKVVCLFLLVESVLSVLIDVCVSDDVINLTPCELAD